MLVDPGKLMRLPIAISMLILGFSAGITGFVYFRQPAPAAPLPVTVTSLLRDFQCGRSETKKVFIRGIEDDYSPAGQEPNYLRPQRRGVRNQTFFAGGSYDQVQNDRRFTDSFQLPANVAKGVFVIRMKPIGDNQNDIIGLGDIRDSSLGHYPNNKFASKVSHLNAENHWSVFNDIYSVDLKGIKLMLPHNEKDAESSKSVLDFVREGGDEGWLDVSVLDDTAVDVVAVAICLEPPRGKGLSFSTSRPASLPERSIVAISCALADSEQYTCNPYTGDTSCSVAQPVACIRPRGLPVPTSLKDHAARLVWSGGQLAFTEPVAASQFRTIGEVDRFCAGHFGKDWRTASFHDGLSNQGMAGVGGTAKLPGRAWVDISDQPYATCWAR